MSYTSLRVENVRHRYLHVDGVKVFCREAGPADAPVVLLPHGYPCSSLSSGGVYAEAGRSLAL